MSGVSVYEKAGAGGETMELSVRHLDMMMGLDTGTVGLKLDPGTVSGLQDKDYPTAPLRQGTKVSRVPLPAELVEHFGHMQCNCSMGLFTEVERAWLTIDSDIYVWRYEDGSDLAYFDGLCDTILNVALVKPKSGILQPHIKYLLCLSTPVEVVLLGVSFSQPDNKGEMHLLPEPLFSLASDQLHTRSIVGTDLGRIFLGGRDGSLYEFVYQAESGWFGDKTKKVNHSSSSLGWLLPGFLGSLSEDPILQLAVDNSRNILYSRSEKGTLTVWYLGKSGGDMEQVVSVTAGKLVEEASRIAATVEPGMFKPLVHVGVVEQSEDSQVHLVVVTGGGVRLYMSTTTTDTTSPVTLRLVHVRLPPGFSPSAPLQRPCKVHTGHYRSGLTLLASSPAEASDVLWVMWGAGTEYQDTVPVEGFTWALDEVVTTNQLDKLYVNSFGGRTPPSGATQHFSQPRKLVVLSAQGALIVSPLLPADCLRQMLIDCGGPESDLVKNYFHLQGGEQACATALVLATSTSLVDRQVSDWATRAFIIYGGEPRLVYPSQQIPPVMSPTSPFHPAVMSTPGPVQSYHQPELQFSHRHNGLYLYISRLLRPVWSQPLLSGNCSSISGSELSAIMSQLHNLTLFLEKNSSVSSDQGRPDSQALLREKQSLLMVGEIVGESLQFLGLWSIVVDHQVQPVVSQLGEEKVNLLHQALFRDLVVRPEGREIAGSLVQSLVQLYLVDSASTDPISNRLRTMCPNLYSVDDVTSSKVHELLLAAASPQTRPADRERMVGEAVGLALQIAGNLQLDVLVSHLASCQSYSRVVEVCLAAANKRDPSNLALHFYKTGENPDDSAGLSAYQTRLSCYTHCTNMLRTLLAAGTTPTASSTVPSSPGPPPPPTTSLLPPKQASDSAEQVFQLMLSSADQLLHVSLYQWLVNNKYTDRLLSVKSPYIEEFLKMSTAQHPETIAMFDLLWKYYEKNCQYVAAAKILSKLADRHTTELDLSGRVAYLSRAIMCVKTSGDGAGELLHHLEEKMEVARVQLTVLESVQQVADVGRLNSDLVDITSLYQDWAEPYQLWECKLAILQCAGHPDPMLVNSIWTNIIDQQVRGNSSSDTKLSSLRQKLVSLGRLYVNSSKYFPLEVIVREVEIVSCRERGSPDWVVSCFQGVGVSVTRLLDVYNRLYTARDSVWLTSGDELHLLKVLGCLLALFTDSPSIVPTIERRQFTVVCQDVVSTYLGELYMKQTQESNSMISTFRDIQSKLDRI